MEIRDPSPQDIDIIQRWNPDYIVVGAGAAGSVVAARLHQETQKRILVVEMGRCIMDEELVDTPGLHEMLWDHPFVPRERNPSLASYVTPMQQSRTYHYPRGIGSGGSTAHHSLIDGRGSLEVYDEIARLLGDPRWHSSSILPYYKKMEKYDKKENC